MTKEIETEILINATPAKVWAILTDFENYPSWNPFITSIKGNLSVGNKITVRIEQAEGKGMTFKPKILSCQVNKEFTWIGHLFFSGIFDGKHKFELIDNENGTTSFRQSEKFKGIVVWLLNAENTRKGFVEMNEKLKIMAEKK